MATEWGPIHLLRNEQAQLVDATAEANLADRLGWWNSVAPGDVDEDGDVDFLVLNCGWNTKYRRPDGEQTHIVVLRQHA